MCHSLSINISYIFFHFLTSHKLTHWCVLQSLSSRWHSCHSGHLATHACTLSLLFLYIVITFSFPESLANACWILLLFKNALKIWHWSSYCGCISKRKTKQSIYLSTKPNVPGRMTPIPHFLVEPPPSILQDLTKVGTPSTWHCIMFYYWEDMQHVPSYTPSNASIGRGNVRVIIDASPRITVKTLC